MVLQLCYLANNERLPFATINLSLQFRKYGLGLGDHVFLIPDTIHAGVLNHGVGPLIEVGRLSSQVFDQALRPNAILRQSK